MTARRRVIIVEDERIVARDLERRLVRFGFEVVGSVPTGEAAILLVEREVPDLVLMDIRLQGEIDGTVAAERIRARFDIPIVFLTAYADDATLAAARISEPYGYVLKPFDERELRIVIEMALYRHAAERERRRLEEQNRRAQKMDAIGQLAGGIAHDFNNVLTVVLTTCNSLLEQLPQSERAHAQVMLIRTASERAARMTRQLLVFARDEPQPTAQIDLGVIVSSTAGMLANLVGDDVELRTHIPASLPPVLARSNEVEQILLNLVVNARHALLEGGTIDVELDAHDEPPRVTLAVRDNGSGMDEATRARIFEPFFTTKDVGEGTGLGLATVYGIVHKSGGTIDVASAPGQGSTFTVTFPACRTVTARATLQAGNAIERLRGKVMVVEDNEAVRAVMRESLRLAGLEVIEARDGIEALGMCREHAGKIDVIVSDLVMPKMNGVELATRLRTIDARAKVVYVSGYPDRTIAGHPEPVQPILYKPFTPHELVALVRAALDP